MGWDRIVTGLTERRERGERPAALFDSVDLKKGTVNIRIGELAFEMDLRRSVAENASSFYAEAKELEAKVDGLRKALAETEAKILESRGVQLRTKSEKEAPAMLRERAWYEKFHWATSSEGFLMLGGRDATTNELLLKRHVDPSDVVFHSDIAGAPFVVVKAEGKTPSEQTLFEAAQLSASYSRGWREGLASLDVYWVKPEQVSKEAPSGEFLSKGMFMIRGQKNFINNVPLRISIGVVDEGEEVSFIGGPVTAVKAHAKNSVELVPGRESSGAIAKTIRGRLAASAAKELREKILKLKIEEIQRFIPSGKSEIARK